MQIRTTLLVVVTLLISSNVYCSQNANLISRDALGTLFLYGVSSQHESIKPASSHTVEGINEGDVSSLEACLLDRDNFPVYREKAENKPFVFPTPSPITPSLDETFLTRTIDLGAQYKEDTVFAVEGSAQESAVSPPLRFPDIKAVDSQPPT